MSQVNEQSFLDAVAQNESSGNKNTKHQTIQSGHQKGQTAIGKYGFLPNTVREFGNRDSSISDYADMGDDEITASLKEHPEDQEKVAHAMFTYLNQRMGGDAQKMAWAWTNGHNTPAKDIDDKKLLASDYVGKFNDNYEAPTEQPPQVAQSSTPRLSKMIGPVGHTAQYQDIAPDMDEDSSSADEIKPYIDQIASAKASQMSTPMQQDRQPASTPQQSSVVPLSYQDHVNNLQRIKQLLGGY